MTHHGHDPMKGHHHPEAGGYRWWHRFILRSRSDTTDHIVRGIGAAYPGVFSYVSGHRDVTQRLVNAYTKTLSWMHSHTASQIADRMPALLPWAKVAPFFLLSRL